MSEDLYKKFDPVKIEYRLYYDDRGRPLAMSCHDHPEGNYLVITREQYEKPNYNCLVVNGKLVFDFEPEFHIQLKRSDSGVPVVAGYANLVVENNEYPKIEYYDRIS